MRRKHAFTALAAAALGGLVLLLPFGAAAAPAQAGTQPQIAQSTTVKPAAALNAAQFAAAQGPSPALRNVQNLPLRGPNAAVLAAAKAGKAAGVPSAGALPAGTQLIQAPKNLGAGSDTTVKGTTFNGLSEGEIGGDWIPPDNGLAAGPNDIVHGVNLEWTAFTKTGTREFAPIAYATWFSNVSTLPGQSDPSVVYRAGHFYMVLLAYDFSTQQSLILVSASQSSTGNGAWCNYAFNGLSNFYSSGDFADFPRVGVTGNALYIGTNQFTFSGENFVGSMLTVIPTAPLTTCSQASATQWVNFIDSNSQLSFTLVPAVNYDAFGSTAEYIVDSTYGSGSQLNVWRIDNPLTSPSWDHYTITSGGYSIPPGAPQPGTGALIDTGDDRVLSAVLRYNNLTVAQSTGFFNCSVTQSAAHIVTMYAPPYTTVAPAYLSSSYFVGCNTAMYYPALSADGFGNIIGIVSFSSSSASPRLYANGRLGGVYWQGFQLIGNSAGYETRGRFGDFSGAAVDPADQSKVWVSGELMQSNNHWQTKIGQVWVVPNPV